MCVDEIESLCAVQAIGRSSDPVIEGRTLEAVQQERRTHENSRVMDAQPRVIALVGHTPILRENARPRQRRPVGHRGNHLTLAVRQCRADEPFGPETDTREGGTGKVARDVQNAERPQWRCRGAAAGS